MQIFYGANRLWSSRSGGLHGGAVDLKPKLHRSPTCGKKKKKKSHFEILRKVNKEETMKN